MLIFFYSFSASLVIGCGFIILLYLAKGKKSFQTNISASSFLIVSLFCYLRMLFFFNIPVKQILLDDRSFLSDMMKPPQSIVLERYNIRLTYFDLFFTLFPAITVKSRQGFKCFFIKTLPALFL